MVTDWPDVYVPAAGEKVGVAVCGEATVTGAVPVAPV